MTIQEAWFVADGRVSLLEPCKMIAKKVDMVSIDQMDVRDHNGRFEQSFECIRGNLVCSNFCFISLDNPVADCKYQ